MKISKSEQLAQHCLDYIAPVCNQNNADRTDVLRHLLKLIQVELNVIDASDPARNR
tara:strand:- start:307 stop:474 length:168 start_codon:yes stop_codon:yes gene_type:complete